MTSAYAKANARTRRQKASASSSICLNGFLPSPTSRAAERAWMRARISACTLAALRNVDESLSRATLTLDSRGPSSPPYPAPLRIVQPEAVKGPRASKLPARTLVDGEEIAATWAKSARLSPAPKGRPGGRHRTPSWRCVAKRGRRGRAQREAGRGGAGNRQRTNGRCSPQISA